MCINIEYNKREMVLTFIEVSRRLIITSAVYEWEDEMTGGKEEIKRYDKKGQDEKDKLIWGKT